MKTNKEPYPQMKIKKIAPGIYCINEGDKRSYSTKGGMLDFNKVFERELKNNRLKK